MKLTSELIDTWEKELTKKSYVRLDLVATFTCQTCGHTSHIPTTNGFVFTRYACRCGLVFNFV